MATLQDVLMGAQPQLLEGGTSLALANALGATPGAMTFPNQRLGDVMGATPQTLLAGGLGFDPTTGSRMQSPEALARAQLASGATHMTPQGTRPATLQQDLSGLGQALLGTGQGIVQDFQNPNTTNPVMQGIQALTQAPGQIWDAAGKFNLTEALSGLMPGDAVRGGDTSAAPSVAFGQGDVPGVVPPAPAEAPTEAPAQEEQAPAAQPKLESPEDIAKVAADPEQAKSATASFFEDPNVSTMMIGLGVALMQGKGIGDAVATAVSALAAKKKQEAAGAAGARAEGRAERQLSMEERKTAAEIRKLEAEARSEGKGDNVKNLTKLLEIVTQSPEGFDLTNEQAAAQAQTLLGQFSGDVDARGESPSRVAAMRSHFEGLSPAARRASAVAFRDMGIPVGEILKAGQ